MLRVPDRQRQTLSYCRKKMQINQQNFKQENMSEPTHNKRLVIKMFLHGCMVWKGSDPKLNIHPEI